MKGSILTGMLCIAIGAGGDLGAGELQQGDREVTLAFSYNDSDLGSVSGNDFGSTESTDLEIWWGWLFTDSHEMGLVTGYSRDEVDGGDIREDGTTDGAVVGGFYQFNFKAKGTFTPYVGVAAVVFGGDLGDVYDTAYGASAGIKFYPFEHGGIVASIGYEELRGDTALHPDADAVDLSVGLLLKY